MSATAIDTERDRRARALAHAKEFLAGLEALEQHHEFYTSRVHVETIRAVRTWIQIEEESNLRMGLCPICGPANVQRN